MTLNCSANNCIYNNYGVCYAGNIEIHGQSATTTSKTNCSTFTPIDSATLSNHSSNTLTTSSDIRCNAVKCNYNSCGTCTAASVQIAFNNASCDTFICE